MRSELVIPEGRYKAVAVKMLENGEPTSYVRFGQSSKGTWFVEMLFRITEGEHEGQEYPWTGYLSEKARDRTETSLGYCGLTGSIEDFGGDQELNKPVEVDIQHDEYKGNVTVKVNFVNSPGGRVSAPPKALLAYLKKQKGKAPAPEIDDDDLPF